MIDPIIETWGELLSTQSKIFFDTQSPDEIKREMMRAYVEKKAVKFHKLCESQLQMHQ